ncbi:hypothetical protein BT63DRAFT_444134 [Microthyrium microscopicum]|uniref:F-box domain-containing protein n=1 Tax=Microthyrium microscopicum TaxID=703497 RepID=A0A6A6TU69_9PEZI|nr:hypothetical protein BT63DRAFT_444134 [Microthyrium microscopicum]
MDAHLLSARESIGLSPPTEPLDTENPSKNAPFPFMMLPCEIRRMIYVAALVSPVPQHLACQHYKMPYADHLRVIANFVCLLRVNRQIHFEASQVLYSENLFYTTPDCEAGCVFRPYRHCIQRVRLVQLVKSDRTCEIGVDGVVRFAGIDMVKLLPALRFIEICFAYRTGWFSESFELTVKPFLQQILRYQRKYTKIQIYKPIDWQEVMKVHNLGRGRWKAAQFYLTDKSAPMVEFRESRIALWKNYEKTNLILAGYYALE